MIIIPRKIFDQMTPKSLTEENSDILPQIGVIKKLKKMDLSELNAWLKKNTVFVGKGSSRSVYILQDMTCLKIAFNSQGVLQNKQEYENTIKENSKNAYPCFSEIYDADMEDWRFLQVEMAKEATERDFPKYIPYISNPWEATIIPVAMSLFPKNFNDLSKKDVSKIWDIVGTGTDIREIKDLKNFLNSERFMTFSYKIFKNKLSAGSETNIKALYQFFSDNGFKKMLPNDITNTENWGVVYRNKIPQLIIIDSGFSENVSTSYHL